MKSVALPISTKSRELTGKIWLSLNLAHNGYKIAIGKRSRIKGLYNEINPDIYFALNSMEKNKSVYKEYNNLGTHVVVLDTEGAIFPSLKHFKDTKVSENTLEYVTKYFAWGEKPAQAIEETQFPDDDIHVTGNPRFDLCQDPLFNIYSKEKNKYENKYGEYILINTNFTACNYSKYYKYYGKHSKYVKSEESIRNLPHPRHDLYIDHAEKNQKIGINYLYLGNFTNSINELSNYFEDTKIVIRPHPDENINYWKHVFSNISNVIVEHDGSVRPWILGSKAVVHNNCTTGVESALLRKPVVSYEPFEFKHYDGDYSRSSHLPKLVSTKAISKSELEHTLANYTQNSGKYSLNTNQKRELKRYIYNIDSYSVNRIIKALDDININPTPDNIENNLKRKIKTITRDPYYKYKYFTGHGSQRFPGLKESEVRAILQNLGDVSNLSTDAISVEPVDPWSEVYWIHPEEK